MNYKTTLKDIDALLKTKQKVMVIVRGVPGSGKSTFAKEICGNAYEVNDGYWFPYHYEADMYYYDKYGKYKWSAEESKNAHKYCQLKTEAAMLLDRPVVVSNTFIKEWEFNEYIKLCVKYNYDRAPGKPPTLVVG